MATTRRRLLGEGYRPIGSLVLDDPTTPLIGPDDSTPALPDLEMLNRVQAIGNSQQQSADDYRLGSGYRVANYDPVPFDSEIANLQSQREALHQPQQRGFLAGLANIGRGISTMDPGQFQQQEDRRFGQEYARKVERDRWFAAQISETQQRKRLGTQDAIATEQRNYEINQRPVQEQINKLNLHAAEQKVKAGARELTEPTYQSWPAGSRVQVTHPDGKTETFDVPFKEAVPKSLQSKEIVGPDSKPVFANFDPATGKYFDQTGKEIPNARPYMKQESGLLGELTPKQLSASLQLSNSLKSHPAYTDMLDIATGMSGVETGLAQKNGFGDITAINAFQRMVDPGATVREGDVALIQSAASAVSKILSDYPIERLRTGAKLPDEVRAYMQTTAKQLYERRARNYNDTIGLQYRSLAQGAGIPFEYVGRDFEVARDGVAAGSSGAGQRGRFNPATGKVEF